MVEEEHIIRENDPPFRPATTEKKEFLLARENTEGDSVGEGNRGVDATVVHVESRRGGVVATGAQAKKQYESGG